MLIDILTNAMLSNYEVHFKENSGACRKSLTCEPNFIYMKEIRITSKRREYETSRNILKTIKWTDKKGITTDKCTRTAQHVHFHILTSEKLLIIIAYIPTKHILQDLHIKEVKYKCRNLLNGLKKKKKKRRWGKIRLVKATYK